MRITSHYPETAYLDHRLLSFIVQGEGSFEISRIEIHEGDSCTSLVDPFHKDIFHLYCREAGKLRASVSFSDEEGQVMTLQTGELFIKTETLPSPSPDVGEKGRNH